MPTQNNHESLNWLGFPSPFPQPVSRVVVPRDRTSASLGAFMHFRGDAVADEATDVQLWYDDNALYVRTRCFSQGMARVQALAARPTPYARDAWGDDALEVSIDVGQTRQRHKHFILPPNGLPITFIGSNNRQEQGWHPQFSYRVTLEEDAWVVEAVFPFAMLGRIPTHDETWGFNVLRVNPDETGGYAQWTPTFGDALRTELFGEIQFAGTVEVNREEEIASYIRRAKERQHVFLTTINQVTAADALCELGVTDWTAWDRYITQRAAPVPLRWDDGTPGLAGIPNNEYSWLLAAADACAEEIAHWSSSPVDQAAFGIERLEVLGDAYLITGDRRYVDAFDRAIQLHSRRIEDIANTIDRPDQLPYHANPYYDAQIIRIEMLAYTYLTMRQAGLSPETHAAMMWTVLRGCRFAAFNISTTYNYGNHQVYESGGLAAVAALFPEFRECREWADVASRSICLHLEREVSADGGYTERCGYHNVAMSYAMHAVATIRANGSEARFPELMAPATLETLERMHAWLLAMTAPDGTFPAFGDYGASPSLRFLPPWRCNIFPPGLRLAVTTTGAGADSVCAGSERTGNAGLGVARFPFHRHA